MKDRRKDLDQKERFPKTDKLIEDLFKTSPTLTELTTRREGRGCLESSVKGQGRPERGRGGVHGRSLITRRREHTATERSKTAQKKKGSGKITVSGGRGGKKEP